MKNSLLIIPIFFIVNTCLSQSSNGKYQYGAMFSQGIFAKTQGTIEINDSIVYISVLNIKSNTSNTNEYKVLSTTNGIVYFTDGVKKYSISFTTQSGKKKGFSYNILINWIDVNANISIAMYYAVKL